MAVRRNDVQRLAQCLKEGTADLDAVDPADGDTALFTAAHAGNTEAVRMLLKAGEQACIARNKSGYGPEQLTLALKCGNRQVLACLLEAGADGPDKNGDRLLTRLASDPASLPLAKFLLETQAVRPGPAGAQAAAPEYDRALIRAAEKNNVPMAGLLLEHAACQGKTPGILIATAIGKKNVEMLRLLIEHGKDAADAQGRESLAIAAGEGKCTAIRYLIDAGANLNAEDRQGDTALTAAISNGERDAAKMLLEAGAQLPRNAARRDLLLQRAQEIGDPELLSKLCRAVSLRNQQGLFDAVRSGEIAQLKACLAMPFLNVALPEPGSGKSAALIAAEAGHAEMTQLLLEHAATAARLEAHTAGKPFEDGAHARAQLDHALKTGHFVALRTLLRAGADVPDADGNTLLARTAKTGDTRTTSRLLWAGHAAGKDMFAWLDTPDKNGETALMQVAGSGNAAMVQLLVEAGANPACGAGFPRPALRRALDRGDMESVSWLLRHGAEELSLKTESTVLMAIRENKPDWLRLLLEAGARKDGGETSPLALAISLDRTEMVRMLLKEGLRLPDEQDDDLG